MLCLDQVEVSMLTNSLLTVVEFFVMHFYFVIILSSFSSFLISVKVTISERTHRTIFTYQCPLFFQTITMGGLSSCLVFLMSTHRVVS